MSEIPCDIGFEDGPAKGAFLCVRRLPILLRVVIAPAGNVDALDQLGDAPAPDEKIYLYRMVGQSGSMRVSRFGPNGRRMGEWRGTARYSLVADQPEDVHMRTKAAWDLWATEFEQLEKQSQAVAS